MDDHDVQTVMTILFDIDVNVQAIRAYLEGDDEEEAEDEEEDA